MSLSPIAAGSNMLACQKALFALPDDLHYLNCAYMSPLARPVEEAGIRGLRAKRVPSLVTPADFFENGAALRAAFADVVGLPESERVSIIPSVSYGIATAANNLPLASGQNVVVVHEQFPSNVYTWKRKVDEAGASLRTVEPRNGQRTSEAWSDAILNTIDASTAIVAVPHVHWADGTVFDLPAIGARARDVGAALVVDGTQSVGAYPFPFDQVQPDAVICAGYKWLLGPYSIGLAWYGPRLDGGVPLEENWISRLGSRDFAGLVEYQPRYEAGAARYDVGERSNFILVPMMLAALEMLKGWGVENIQARCRHLVAPVAEAAAALGYEIADASSRADHLFGIRAPGRITAAELRAAMERRNVSVSVRGDAVRVAPNVYNDEDDLSALLEALEVVARGSE